MNALWCVPCVVLGFLSALVTTREQVRIDYDSGLVERVTSVGPFAVFRDDDRGVDLGRMPLPNGQSRLTGKPDWHVALMFWPGRRVSPNTEAGHVLKMSTRLASILSRLPPDRVPKYKEEFLRSLSAGDRGTVDEVVSRAESELLAKYERNAR